MSVLIEKDKKGWFFWDESFANKMGYYKSKEEAKQALKRYCEEVLNESFEELHDE